MNTPATSPRPTLCHICFRSMSNHEDMDHTFDAPGLARVILVKEDGLTVTQQFAGGAVEAEDKALTFIGDEVLRPGAWRFSRALIYSQTENAEWTSREIDLAQLRHQLR